MCLCTAQCDCRAAASVKLLSVARATLRRGAVLHPSRSAPLGAVSELKHNMLAPEPLCVSPPQQLLSAHIICTCHGGSLHRVAPTLAAKADGPAVIASICKVRLELLLQRDSAADAHEGAGGGATFCSTRPLLPAKAPAPPPRATVLQLLWIGYCDSAP